MNYDFITIPREVVMSDKIRDTDRLVYGVIYSMSQMSNKRFIGKNTTIAKMVGISVGSVTNSLGRLVEAKFITCLFKDTNKRIRTEIIPLIDYKNIVEVPSNDGTLNKSVPSSDGHEVPSNDGDRVPSNDGQNKNIYISNNINISKNNIITGETKVESDFIYKKLYIINKDVYNSKGWKINIEAVKKLSLKQNLKEILEWYINVFSNQYTPKAYTPSELLNKWAKIEEYYKQNNKTSNIDALMKVYNN